MWNICVNMKYVKYLCISWNICVYYYEICLFYNMIWFVNIKYVKYMKYVYSITWFVNIKYVKYLCISWNICVYYYELYYYEPMWNICVYPEIYYELVCDLNLNIIVRK